MPLGTLPPAAKKIWESVFEASKKDGDSEEVAAKKAWAAVKRTWIKKDGKWIKKSDALIEMSMYITKANLDGDVMRWQATNSDTGPDTYEERMSVDLFRDFIGRVNRREDVPEPFRSAVYSKFWQGGMPYLSVSHYSDLDGDAVPGEPVKIYTDGNKLKAKGVLYDSPLGHAVFRSLLQDKNKKPENKIRISIGFLDLGHKHSETGEVWERKSLTDTCPLCKEGVKDKIYVKGYLVHLALTRVPANKRTEIVLEEKSEMTKKITRKDDAKSIVGDLAEEIDAKSKAKVLRSDVEDSPLVEMSEAETEEETQELIAEVTKSEDADGEPKEVVRPAPEEPEESEEPEEPETEEVAEVAEVEKTEVVEEKADAGQLPYGGATSMMEAKKAKEAIEEMYEVMDLWQMFSNVAWNIIDRDDVTDKKAAFVGALDEFKGLLAAKAMVEFSQAVVERSEPADEDVHALKPALDALLSAVDNATGFEGDINAKLNAINPTLQELGEAITDYVKTKSVAQEPPAPNKNDDILDSIKTMLQPVVETVGAMNERLGLLEAKSSAAATTPRSRIPAPRSLQVAPPALTEKADTGKPKPGSLRDIINKSVGITE
jgi:hypothetical protein